MPSHKKDKLNKAFHERDSEFYTILDDVQKELTKYLPLLKNKKVHLPCDNKDSSFYIFFKYYQKQYQYTLTNSCFFDGVGTRWQSLNFKDYDFIFTNPPFSDIRYLIPALIKSGVKFSIITSNLGLSLNSCSDYFINKKIIVGEHFITKFLTFNGSYKSISGQWATNLPCPLKRPLIMTKSFGACHYSVYDKNGFLIPDLVYIKRIKDLPTNWFDRILCPIGIFHYDYEPWFTILSAAKSHTHYINIADNNNNLDIFKRFIIKRTATSI